MSPKIHKNYKLKLLLLLSDLFFLGDIVKSGIDEFISLIGVPNERSVWFAQVRSLLEYANTVVHEFVDSIIGSIWEQLPGDCNDAALLRWKCDGNIFSFISAFFLCCVDNGSCKERILSSVCFGCDGKEWGVSSKCCFVEIW